MSSGAPGIGAPPQSFCDNPSAYFQRFTEEQRVAVVRVHLFTQLYWLEGVPFRNFGNIQYIRPQYLKITVRHADWWFWETNTPLRLQTQWMDHLKFAHNLNTLDLELETMERDKDQMETIVKDLVQRRIPLTHSRMLTTRGNTIQRERYMGTAVYNNSIYYSSHIKRWFTGRPLDTLEQLPYVVSIIRWTAEAST